MLTTIAHTSLVIRCSSKERPTERATQRSHLSPQTSYFRAISGLSWFSPKLFHNALTQIATLPSWPRGSLDILP